MHRFIIILSLFGLLFLTACGNISVYVYNAESRRMGEIILEDEHNAVLKNTHGDVRGRVRGNSVRDDSGKRIGTVIEKDGKVLLENGDSEEVGSLENSTDCYGKGNEMIGSISSDVGHEIGGAACLAFFLQ